VHDRRPGPVDPDGLVDSGQPFAPMGCPKGWRRR